MDYLFCNCARGMVKLHRMGVDQIGLYKHFFYANALAVICDASHKQLANALSL